MKQRNRQKLQAPLLTTVKVNGYEVIARAVEDGVRYGWRRVLKYHQGTRLPSDETIADHIGQAVLSELCEVLRFEDP